MTLLATQDSALAPVRATMLRGAAERADRIRDHARGDAQALVADARRQADTAIARARARGAAEAEPVGAAQLNRSRRAARSVALGAALAASDELAGRIRAAVLALREEPDYPRLRADLSALALEVAGPGAEISEHSAGGVIARAGGTVVDCSLPRLADRAVEALGARIARMCAP